MSIHFIRIVLLIGSAITVAAHLSAQTQPPSILEAVQQLKEGDAFRAVLTLNDVIAQNPSDPKLLARAHALRAMAFLAQNQPERAKTAAERAISTDPGFVPSNQELNASTIALFEATRAPAPANPEAAGESAEAAGQLQQAFLFYVSAYRALPHPAPQSDDQRLRERIIRIVTRLATAPDVPARAREHVKKADSLLEAETILGSAAGASSQAAAIELRSALRAAPWWPEATLKLATVLQRLQRVDEALVNLNLYKLADPQGAAAAIASKTAAPAVPATAARAMPAAAKPGNATIVVYRSYNFIAGGRVNIDCNGQRIAELQNARVVTFKIPAGKHTLTFLGDEEIPIEVEAGREYYFRSSVGGMSFNTRAVAVDEAKAYLKENKPKPNDTKRTRTTECRAFAQ